MNYSTDQLTCAIDHTGLPKNHRSSLRGLVAMRRQPLFLGHFVRTVGLLVLVLLGYFIYMMFRVVGAHPDLPSTELSKVLDPIVRAGAMCFLISLFLLNGADQYLKRTRQSRALCELLMKKQAANATSDATSEPAPGAASSVPQG